MKQGGSTQTRHSFNQPAGVVWILAFPTGREVCDNFTRIGADLTAKYLATGGRVALLGPPGGVWRDR